jgi:hypothetical protein
MQLVVRSNNNIAMISLSNQNLVQFIFPAKNDWFLIYPMYLDIGKIKKEVTMVMLCRAGARFRQQHPGRVREGWLDLTAGGAAGSILCCKYPDSDKLKDTSKVSVRKAAI